MSTREWNAYGYDQLPLPHVEWGRRTIERLALRGDEFVLDAGCGTGRDAELLLQTYPGVSVLGVDASVAMVERARERLQPFGDRARVQHSDLTDLTSSWPMERATHQNTPQSPQAGRVDAIMSVACFHWIADQRRLFEQLHAVLRPGGRLVSDCGGAGNIAIVQAAIAEVSSTPERHTTFASVDDTRANLEAAGFVGIDVALRPHPVRIEDSEVMEAYLAIICLGGRLEDMPAEQRAPFVTAVRQAMTEPVLDYQRLEIDARRS